jgi:L-aspartate oxidase
VAFIQCQGDLESHIGRTTKTSNGADLEVAELKHLLQRTMSRHVGVVRDASGLAEAALTLSEITQKPSSGLSREQWEVANMSTAATAIVEAARRREESRGAHFRSDFPEQNESLAGHHLILVDGLAGSWRFGSLETVREPAGASV